MKRVSEYIQRIECENITISILLTTQCNFECRHCMYYCGPTNSPKYISNEQLQLIKSQIDYLAEYDVNVGVNLIGGEPTLNLSEFERVLNIVGEWNLPLDMTSNGWWMRNEDTTRRFFKIILPYIDTDGEGVDGYKNKHQNSFTLRISNDEYHDECRGFNIDPYFKESWEYLTMKRTIYCSGCDTVFPDNGEYGEGCDCPHCGDYIYDDYEVIMDNIPKPNPNDPWFNIEKSHGSRGVISVGRGTGWGHINHSFGSGCYESTTHLTYDPNGNLRDFCCRGSWINDGNTGNTTDNPIALLMAASEYKKKLRPHCSTCQRDIRDFDFIKAVTKYTRQIEQYEDSRRE